MVVVKRLAIRLSAGVVLWGMVSAPVVTSAASDAEKGKALYQERHCGLCHQIGGQGGKMGPDLSVVGDTRSRGWLITFLKDPKGTVPGVKMRPFKGADEELTAVAEYLLSLKK